MGRKSSGMFVDIICKFTAAIVLAQKNETDAKSGLLVRECVGCEGLTTGV
jgi:hypothetical protein